MSEPSGLEPAHELVERALHEAAGDQVVVLVEDACAADVRFANNTTTTNGVRRDRRVSVARFVAHGDGFAAGVASSSGQATSVEELVDQAGRSAESAPAAEDAAPLFEGPADPDFADEPGTTSLSVFSAMLGELGEAFGRARSDGNVLAGFATHEVATAYLGTSTGLRRRYLDQVGTFELAGRSSDGQGSSWSGVATSDFSDVSVAAMEQKLLERLTWAQRRIDLPAGRYETILPPDAVADLMIVLAEAASGKDAEDGWNVFSAGNGATKLGARVSELPFDLTSDPHDELLSCVPFLAPSSSSTDVSIFDAGAPLGPTSWLSGGHLSRLRYHRAAAARAGVDFTPPIDNLTLALPGATSSLEELVARTERGLLLNCLWYIREVDLSTLLLTGLTRDGVYLVEGGEVVGAVNNFRFNESPLDLLNRSSEVGETTRALSREWGEWMRRTAMPSLRIPDFNMSSVSPAS